MASTSAENTDTSILTPDYIALLHGMCEVNQPSIHDVIAIFQGFRRALDVRKPKNTSASSASSQTSKKRGCRSAAGDGSRPFGDDVGFERSCTWQPGERPCWIKSDLDLWNQFLARNCMELHEHKWGEFSLQGHPWAENEPKMPDVLHVSLLIHMLLRQHRCVTRILLDLSITRLERIVMWHALSTGALGVKRLEYKQCYLELRGLMTPLEVAVVCEAIATMKNLTTLCMSLMLFNDEVVRTIGDYVEHAPALAVLELRDVEVDDTRGGAFLDHLARNRSLKTLCVHEHFLTARKGQALADVVRNHVTLEEIDVTGFPTISPTALLQAAVQSKSLRTLTVRDCRNQAPDIEALASALRLNPFPPVKDAEPASPPPRSRLRNLTFKNCTPGDYILEAAYAKLIGGALVNLTLSNCGLGGTFAMAAAFRLYFDKRLRELNVENNDLPIGPLRSLIGALEVNKVLHGLVLNMTAQHRPRRLSTLFTMIHRINALSRLKLQWVYPRSTDFSSSVLAAHTNAVYVKLDNLRREEAAEYLHAIASNKSLDMAQIECTTPLEPAVFHKLANTLASTRSLRHLMLNVTLPDADVVKLFRALQRNRSVSILVICYVTFSKRNAQALGRLVENNRALLFLNINLHSSDPKVDRILQSRRICQELKETVRRNRFIASISVNLGLCDYSKDYVIKDVLGRNFMRINQALRFVEGSTEKADALAFETVQHNASVSLWLQVHRNILQESADKMVTEARRRLASNYFILVNVVKAKTVCQRNKKTRKKTLFDNLGRVLQAQIFSYLNLTDVVDL